MPAFDLIEYQYKVRNAYSPKRLFELWEEACRCYDRRCLNRYELEEIRETVWPLMKMLTDLQSRIEESFSKQISK